MWEEQIEEGIEPDDVVDFAHPRCLAKAGKDER